MEELLELTKRHKVLMEEKGILISVYRNASGYLWQMMKNDGGTDLGWSEFSGDCEFSGAFTTYEKALKNALDLAEKVSLEEFKKECPNDRFHWSNYSLFIRGKLR